MTLKMVTQFPHDGGFDNHKLATRCEKGAQRWLALNMILLRFRLIRAHTTVPCVVIGGLA